MTIREELLVRGSVPVHKRAGSIRWPPVLLLSLVFFSCAYREPVNFWDGSDSHAALIALSKNSQAGLLPCASEGKLEYELSGFRNVNNEYALEIGYSWQGEAEGQAVLVSAGLSWELPKNIAFLDSSFSQDSQSRAPPEFYYTVPLVSGSIEKLTINWIPENAKTADRNSALKIISIKLTDPWYGVVREENKIRLSPFVFSESGALVIDPPVSLSFRGSLDIRLTNAGKITVEGNSEGGPGYFRVEGNIGRSFRIDQALITGQSYPLRISGPDLYGAEIIPDRQSPLALPGITPVRPIPADPGMVISWPRERWRDERYEVFRWQNFPSILIFDMADYDIQDRFLKRLAFYAEKAGFRGRLAADSEIADLHGWNAHDYRSSTLAAFFDLARKTSFPLLPEERELESLLLDSGIIRNSAGSIIPGDGAIISISRESEDYLRALFMTHEGFHGLYFIDNDFREFCRQRWQGLAAVPRAFILSYFEYQSYDTKDNDLVINEFMAHIMQQPVSQAEKYFGETLAGRIDASSWRRTVLPPKDESSGTWPQLAEAFRIEAEAFSRYAERRWGLAAGKVRAVTLTF